MTFQELILALQHYWADQGCVVIQPYDMEVGAGTFHVATFLKAVGPEPWNAAYVQPSRRPTDGRYGDNPNRLQHYYQFQVVMKPSPLDFQDRFLGSLRSLGVDPLKHDIRFVEDDWESPTLGAWGLGWEVWLNGMEIAQFTYFQQAGGLDCDPVMGEITYGLERIAMYLQEVESVFDLLWTTGPQGAVSYGDIYHQNEVEQSTYNFEHADVEFLFQAFEHCEQQAMGLAERGLSLPAYEQVLKASHTFNLLDARHAVSVTERQRYILRVRTLARAAAQAYYEARERLGFPCRQPRRATMSDKQDVLFELGTEELPPLALGSLSRALLEGFRTGLEQEEVSFDDAEAFATPRRLAVLIQGCAARQPDRESERLGPAVSAAFDASGTPTRAAEGFARSCGVPVGSLERVAGDKGERLAYRWREPGQATRDLLPRIAERAVQQLPIPKRMRWGRSRVQFVRPVHWLVFLLGDEIVPCELLGLRAGRQSHGHRFHSAAPITVDAPESYARQLRDEGWVIAGFAERRERIREQVDRLAVEAGGQGRPDDALLDEVTALTEWPVALRGSFDAAFLEVPVELLVLTMKQDQRYFPVFDADGGLMNQFIAVANIDSTDPDVVRQGNERVIRPRFADAKFFWDQDLGRRMDERLEDLKHVVFQERLGSMYDKSARIAALAADIALLIGADTDKARRAGWLSRCDLVSETVFEFPEMQGIAGRYLLEHEQAEPDVARAMDEVYMPRHAGDVLPETKVGTVVSLAEKLDTLVGIFAIGEPPSGDKDPYALRRAALGALRMLREKQLRVPLWAVLEIAHNRLDEALRSEATVDAVYTFMMERLKGIYLDEGVDASVFSAVVAVEPSTLIELDQRIVAVTAFRALPEAGALAEANKRARNILRKAGFDEEDAEVDGALLSDDAEVRLHDQAVNLERQIEPLLEAGDFDAALKLLAGLREPLDRFFNDVMVMSEDPGLRDNRLALLSRLSQLFLRVADISQLQISTRQGQSAQRSS